MGESMYSKQFSERLNQELDKMEVPKAMDERVDAFSKLIHIPRFKAETILNGHVPPEADILDKIIQELEVDHDWLLGKDAS
jgi:hypothetical protein